MRAYNVKGYQIGGPGWMDTELYDVVAKVPDGITQDQIPVMLQNLLTERFRMTVHLENKPQRVYVIVTGKNRPSLTKSTEVVSSSGNGLPGSFALSPEGKLEFKGATLAALADALSGLLDRPIVDKTGIEGTFDIGLNISMQDLIGLKNAMRVVGPSGEMWPSEDSASGSIFSAIQKLGLKLESRSLPIKRIVVDTVEKVPTGN